MAMDHDSVTRGAATAHTWGFVDRTGGDVIDASRTFCSEKRIDDAPRKKSIFCASTPPEHVVTVECWEKSCTLRYIFVVVVHVVERRTIDTTPTAIELI